MQPQTQETFRLVTGHEPAFAPPDVAACTLRYLQETAEMCTLHASEKQSLQQAGFTDIVARMEALESAFSVHELAKTMKPGYPHF